MRPLILEFTETPELKNIDYSIIEYSMDQNLSVLKKTDIPAISYVNMDTATFTKTTGEPSDSDNDRSFKLKRLLDTSTDTKTIVDETDSDNDFKLKMRRLLDTSTDTFNSNEPSDSDSDRSSLKLLMDTQTITESTEPTDSDK
ncbi:hypothetical protein [Aquimarina sp. AU119]|uniref:hypothetical protein n=1 Tax=Aquimarina sp. AU119 TaxID=2108528 RepID=UPI000D69FFEB|nr:hypothetical protein [Aquimarina sp. AU119]